MERFGTVILADADGLGHMGGWGWGMAITSWVFMVLVVVLVVWGVRGGFVTSQPGRGSTERSARRLLDERYARGEIERDEYLQRRADLEQ